MVAEPGDHSPLKREAVKCSSLSSLPKVLRVPLQKWLGNVGNERKGWADISEVLRSDVGDLQESFHIISRGLSILGVSSNLIRSPGWPLPYSLLEKNSVHSSHARLETFFISSSSPSLHGHLGDDDSLPDVLI